MTELDIKRKASELLQRGRFDEAVAAYQALVDNSRKQNPAILNLIGDLYVKQGNYQQGFENYLSAAKAYKEEGLFHNGIAVGKKILRLDREQTEVYGMLADLYARQGLGMDALKFLREYATRKEKTEEFPAALAAFAEACGVIGDFPDVHIAYGEMLERVDRLEDAATCYANAAQAYSERGWADQAEQLERRAKAVSAGGQAAAPTRHSRVADMMSLRSLDESDPATPASAPVAASASAAPVAPADDSAQYWNRPDEPAGLTETPAASDGPGLSELDTAPASDGAAPWSEYQAEANPALPPPPPLPPRAAAVAPIGPPPGAKQDSPAGADHVPADPADLFIEPPGIAAGATPEDGLTLDLSGAGSLSEALEEMAALESGPVDSAAAPPASSEEPVEAEAFDLADLPGVILPGPAPGPKVPAEPVAADPAESIPPPAMPVEAAPEAPALPPAPVPSAEAPPAEVPVAEAATGTPDAPDQDLQEFFEQTAAQEDEHTVVIGDDFELIREGGDVHEVIADFRDATMEILDLDDFQAHYDLGTTYMEMELFDEAAAEFEIAARGEDYALASQEMLGYCFLRKGQIDMAILELEKGLGISGYEDHHKLGLLYNLGIACGVLDQEQQAIAHFQRILEIEPDFRDTRSRLERLVQNSA